MADDRPHRPLPNRDADEAVTAPRRRPRPALPPAPPAGPGISGLLAGWHTFSRRMGEVRDLEGLSDGLMAFIRSQVKVEYAAIYMLDLVDGSIRLLQADGLSSAERKEAARTAWVRHPGMVLRTGRVLHVPDVDHDEQKLSRDSARSFVMR